MVTPENVHPSTILQPEHSVFKNIYAYIYTEKKVTANKGGYDSEKEQRGYMRRFGGRKGRKTDVLHYILKKDSNEVDSYSSVKVGYGGGNREPA